MASAWLALTLLLTRVIIFYNIPWPLALADASLTATINITACVLCMINMGYYRPGSKGMAYLAAWVILPATVSAGLSHSILSELYNANIAYGEFLQYSLPVRKALGLLLAGGSVLIALLWHARSEQKNQADRDADAQKLAREAELNRLHMQLQPHFLFNSLNSISALIVSRPDEAMDMVYKLSDFLRGTLRKDEEQWVPLKDELVHLQLYLDIEKVRFGHRLNTGIECDGECDAMFVPSLVLQPLLENAIKFGLYDTTEEVVISVKAKAIKDMLTITITNPYDPVTASPRHGTGFGISGVKRRLYLLFGRNDLLETLGDGKVFNTRLRIPQ